jgi:aldose 1-epimerase
MSFNITQEKQEDLDLLRISDLSTGIRVSILPESGALLHEFSIPRDQRRIQAVNGYQNQEDLKKNYSASYKSAKLSPFVCRLAEGRYQFDGESFEFANKFADGSAIHGILYNKPFRVVEKTTRPHEASIGLEYLYKKDDPAYPFEYKITVRYTLQNSGRLRLETTVRNHAEKSIPIADGWHPYFSLEGKVNDWLLSFRSRKNIAFDEKLIPSGQMIDSFDFYSATRIGERFFDHCYLLDQDWEKPAAVLYNPQNGLCLSLLAEPSYPYLQIYTPPDRKTIALENLSAAPDSFNNQLGLIILEPDHLQSFSVVYQLEFR